MNLLCKNKIVLLGLAVAVTSSIFFSGIVYANADDLAKQTFSKYLTAIQKKDIDSAVSLYVDERCKGDIEEKVLLKEALSDPNQQLDSFSIIDEKIDKGNYQILVAKLIFKNGEISEIPFKLQYQGKQWVVRVASELPQKDKYKIIKKGKEIPTTDQNTINHLTITGGEQLTTWNVHLGGDDLDVSYSVVFCNIKM